MAEANPFDKTRKSVAEKSDSVKKSEKAGEEEVSAQDEEKAPEGEKSEEVDAGNDETQDEKPDEDDAAGEGDTTALNSKVEKVFESFLNRCQSDIDERRRKRNDLFDTHKQEQMMECTFQPKISENNTQKSNGQKIGHSLYYRGLLDMQSRLDRQKKRLEEVVEEEKASCPFKPNRDPASLGNNTKYADFITPPPVRTPRMSALPNSARKEPLRLDLSEELNQNARDARDLYRADPRKQKTKTGYIEASIDKFHQLTSQLKEGIEANEAGGEM